MCAADVHHNSMDRDELVSWCDQYLDAASFKDFTLNGLQVAGRDRVQRIMTGVTACQALLDQAVEWEADLVLVHHGFFWKNEPVAVTGMKQRRMRSLLMNGINLLAYHLPLDAHQQLGNNACLAHRMGWRVEGCLDDVPGRGLLWHGRLMEPQRLETLSARIACQLGRDPTVIKAPRDEAVERIAWCTGGAQDMLAMAAEGGAQAFVSGEISERTTHVAREMGIHYIAAGHHATERDGVRRLGEWLSSTCGLEHRFVDIDNPA